MNPVKDGANVVLISGRSQTHNILVQEITNVLIKNGPGDYYFKGWARMTGGKYTDTTSVSLQLTKSDGKTDYYYNFEIY